MIGVPTFKKESLWNTGLVDPTVVKVSLMYCYRSRRARARHTLSCDRLRHPRVRSSRAGCRSHPSQCKVSRKVSKDPCRVHRQAPCTGRASESHLRETCLSPAVRMENSFSAPHNSDPNKQYMSQNDNDYAI